MVETGATDPDEAREFLLILGDAGDVEAELVRLLDGAMVRGVARVVELENPNRRNNHLDRVDRVVLARSLQRLHRAVEEITDSIAKLGDEAVARVGGVSKRDARFARRHAVDELGNFVACVACLLTRFFGTFEPSETGDTGEGRADGVEVLREERVSIAPEREEKRGTEKRTRQKSFTQSMLPTLPSC